MQSREVGRPSTARLLSVRNQPLPVAQPCRPSGRSVREWIEGRLARQYVLVMQSSRCNLVKLVVGQLLDGEVVAVVDLSSRPIQPVDNLARRGDVALFQRATWCRYSNPPQYAFNGWRPGEATQESMLAAFS